MLKKSRLRTKLLTRKIEELEFILHKSHKRSTLFDNVNKRLIENDSRRKVLESRLNKEVNKMNGETTLINEKLSIINEEVSTVNSRIIEHQSKADELQKRFSEDKKDITFKLQIDDLKNQLEAIGEWKSRVDELLTHHQQDISRHGVSIEKARSNIDEFQTLLTKDYVKNAELKSVSESLEQKLTTCSKAAEDVSSKLTSTENYIEKYLPVKVHKFIVSSLRNVFESKRELRKLKDYEAKRDWLFKQELQNDTGIPSDFKTSVYEENPRKLKKVKLSSKTKKFKIGTLRREGKMDSFTSNGTTSMKGSPKKKSYKKSRRKESSVISYKKSRRKESSVISHNSSQFSVKKDPDEPSRMYNLNKRVASQMVESKNESIIVPQHTVYQYPSIEVNDPTLVDKTERQSVEKEVPVSSKVLTTIRDELKAEDVPVSAHEVKSQDFRKNEIEVHTNNEEVKAEERLPSESPLDFQESEEPEEPEEDIHDEYSSQEEREHEPVIEDNEFTSEESSSEFENSESESEETDSINRRVRSRTELVSMTAIDEQFVKFLTDMSNSIKGLQVKTEKISNGQMEFEDNFSKSLQKNFKDITLKVRNDLVEQKDYINALHTDVNESIKQSKRDRSDTYLDLQTLKQKIQSVHNNNAKTEDYLMRTTSSYMNILESIKTHLYLLKQKDLHEFEAKLYGKQEKPYVAAEGDILNLQKKSQNAQTTEEMTINYEAEGLDLQLIRLDQLLNENNSLLEEKLKNEFDVYEERNALLSSVRKKSKLPASDSMKRLRSAKMRKDAMSPGLKSGKGHQTSSKPRDSTISKLPAFGPFKSSDNKYHQSHIQNQSFNDRKILTNKSMRWTDHFSPERGQNFKSKNKTTILTLNPPKHRRVESAIGRRTVVNY
ncbi:unnamed protein product [Moneuplotes crassus]|uniref:Uncharacterized protein n=2 Tax=Euplotes crassus TaxID=5936 RepID=A0AAD1Y033_EUPCR|nr:unnamed protein product [Moneuplotes crassus]